MVSSINYESPLHDLPNLAEQIKSTHFHGEVVFDLLCVNGMSRNRFISMFFNSSFDRATKKALMSHELENAQSEFYRHNPNYLHSSVLHEEEISAFLNI
ncbi:type II toxin-antitoxin system RnlB family antitoxin [Photobacterium iliopiscarium]|uniref:type II toxin-antitoxin system RnlB family antitoxin n=1 Tax=Photobacterium iliopiscarium TaxID=56192 RepID=UPI001F1EB599|nr:type II toxin-antitoxin system RnlB family antitoxin [Photobacterium iliopiscarium]